MRANGVRYPRVGGIRERRFAGTSFKPRNLPENAATPTRRVHAVLGGFPFLNRDYQIENYQNNTTCNNKIHPGFWYRIIETHPKGCCRPDICVTESQPKGYY